MTPKQKALQRRVDEVLHYMWDPVGVSGVPEARDEYDTYALCVLGLLEQGADADAIVEYLVEIERSRMEVAARLDRARDVAEALICWRRWINDQAW